MRKFNTKHTYSIFCCFGAQWIWFFDYGIHTEENFGEIVSLKHWLKKFG